MLHTDIDILSKMQAIHLDITLWSARKKLTPEDFGQTKDTLPPEELASLGSKRIAPPERLRIFSALKARAVSLLDKHGIRFLSGWLIPEDSNTLVRDGLKKIEADFFHEKTVFLSEYQQIISYWVARHQEWQSMLEDSIVSPAHVAERLKFRWHCYRLSTVQTSDFAQEVGNLADSLFDEISRSADEMWRDSFSGRSSITHKTLSPLRNLEAKLTGLTFVEPHVAPVAALIHTAIERLPARGNITGPDLAMIQGMVCLLRDKTGLMSHARKIMEGHDPGLLLPQCPTIDLPVPVAMPPASPSVISDSMGLW